MEQSDLESLKYLAENLKSQNWKCGKDSLGRRKSLWIEQNERSKHRICLDLWQIRQVVVTKLVLRFICTIKDERIIIKLCPQAFLQGKQMRMEWLFHYMQGGRHWQLIMSVHYLLREETISDSWRQMSCKYTCNWLKDIPFPRIAYNFTGIRWSFVSERCRSLYLNSAI